MSALSHPVPATPGSVRGRAGAWLLTCAAIWSALLIIAAAMFLAPELGYRVLYFAGSPMVLTGLVAALLRPRSVRGQRVGRATALALCALALLAVVTSFVVLSFLVLPTVVLLISAALRPASTYR